MKPNRSQLWRLPLFCGCCVVVAVSIGCHFLPWRFVIPGYRFPYHGATSLILASAALLVALIGTTRNWRRATVNWPWLTALVLIGIQVVFLVAFLQGPDIAVGRGETVSPWGRTPLEMQFDVRPLWGVYAALVSALIGMGLSALSLLVNRMDSRRMDFSRMDPDRMDPQSRP